MANFRKYIFIVLAGMALFVMCRSGVENEDLPPSRVRIVPKTPEDAVEEHGIDAYAVVTENNVVKANAIYLEWYQNPEQDIAAYNIYRKAGDSTGTFQRIARVEKSFGVLDTFYIDMAVELYQRYFYYIKAEDEAGQEGPASRKVNYALVPWADLESPIRYANFDGQFVWTFQQNYFPPSFVFRLERQVAENTYVNFFTKQIELLVDYDPHQVWSISRLVPEELLPIPTGTYRWRIDVVGSEENQGSESNWETFRVP